MGSDPDRGRARSGIINDSAISFWCIISLWFCLCYSWHIFWCDGEQNDGEQDD